MINYPTTLDTLSNPSASDLMENVTATLDHDVQHSNVNDAIEALEAKVGVNNSAVTTSLDYKVNNALNYKVMFTVGSTNADYITDGTADNIQVDQAITAANAAGGGIVFIKDGTYNFSAGATLKANVYVMGAGQNATIIKNVTAGDYMFRKIDTSTIAWLGMSDMTIDMESNSTSSGIRVEYVTDFYFRNLTIKNGGDGSDNAWGLYIGVSNAADTEYRNLRGKIENCTFSGFNTTFEELLILNSKDINVSNCEFISNIKTSGPGLGIYQVADGINITNCTFSTIAGPSIYYSLSTNNIDISNNKFYGTGTGVQGSNLSDNGAFGYGYVRGLRVIDNYFTGCDTALQLGATDGAIVTGNCFEENVNIGIFLDEGNQGVSAVALNTKITSNTFRRNNTSGTDSTIHTPIFFSSIGGSMNCIIDSNTFYDNAPGGVEYQVIPIGFNGAYTWDRIIISNNRLESLGAYINTPIVLTSSAALGTSCAFYNNFNMNPECSYSQGNVTGATTFTRKSGSTIRATLTGNITVTLTDSISPIAGDKLRLILTQDATGSRTATWPSNFKKAGGTLTLSTGANAVDVIGMEWDGTYWRETSRSLNLS